MDDTRAAPPQPLAGLRVIEFTHMVMGPTCGMVLADLGAEVVKVEPLGGGGHAPAARRGHRLLPDVQPQQEERRGRPAPSRGRRRRASPRGDRRRGDRELPARHDGQVRPRLSEPVGVEPRLVYASHKGFLPGPYEHRTALDEVVQMMGGLAYMTGRPGDPLRAGSSVNDIMGGMFGAIGVLGALLQRGSPGAAWRCSRRSSRTTCSSSGSTCSSTR
jgi:hypothetical protein